jgi:hypothetical protein
VRCSIRGGRTRPDKPGAALVNRDAGQMHVAGMNAVTHERVTIVALRYPSLFAIRPLSLIQPTLPSGARTNSNGLPTYEPPVENATSVP